MLKRIISLIVTLSFISTMCPVPGAYALRERNVEGPDDARAVGLASELQGTTSAATGEKGAEAAAEGMGRRRFLEVLGLGTLGATLLRGVPAGAQADVLSQIKGLVSQPLMADCSKFIDGQRITGAQRVMPTNISNAALDRYRQQRGREFGGFNFNGLYYSYRSDRTNSGWEKGAKYLAQYGRVHIYDTSLGILGDLAAGRLTQAQQAVNALIELAKDEEALGFMGGWHFSYNTNGDSWLDPRAPMGGTLWAIKAIYEYIRIALPNPQLHDEAMAQLQWVNGLVKRLVFNMQVMDEKDPRYGLVRAMVYNSLLDVNNFSIDDIGYRAYEGEQNKVSELIIFEHNADCVDVLRLAALVTEEAGIRDDAFISDLAQRHELLMNAIWNKAWVGDHYVTAMAPNGALNESVAVDNNTWLAQSFLAYDEERAWTAIEYVWNNFRTKGAAGQTAEKVGDLVLEDAATTAQRQNAGQPFTSVYFFREDFSDPFVNVSQDERVRLTQMCQTEATFGYIYFLLRFAYVTKDSQRRDEALRRAGSLYESMAVQLKALYPKEGLPYATLFALGYFNTLPAMAGTATAAIVSGVMQGVPLSFIGVQPPDSFKFNPTETASPGEVPQGVKPAGAGAITGNIEVRGGKTMLDISILPAGSVVMALQMRADSVWVPSNIRPEMSAAGQSIDAGKLISLNASNIRPNSGLVIVFKDEQSRGKFLAGLKNDGVPYMEWWLWANEYGVNPENCAKVGILKAYQVEKTDNGTVNLKEQPVSGNASVEGILPNIMRTVPAQVGPGTPALIASRKPLPGDVIAAAIGNNPGVANGIGRREFLAAIAGGALSFLSERTVAQYGGGSTSGNFPTTGTGVGPSAKIPEWQLIYGRLTIPEKVAQLMSMGFSTTNPLEDPWAMDLFSKGIGVFTLYPPNMENPEQVARMLLDIRKQCKVSPIFNVDRETGRLDNTPAGSTMFPGNMALGAIATADMALGEELAWQVSYTVGNELRAMGINWNLAPVADVNSNPKNPVIGIRSFGEDPATVAALTRKTVEGYRMVGVSCTAKHFPGHGDAAEDSHALLWAINRPKPDIDATELPPFEAAVSAEVDAVMTAHLGFPAYDSAMMEVKDPKDPTKTVEMNTPATMSKPILTGLLREEMKFQGVIISDAMEMGAIIDNIGIGEASVRAILAGADCIITGADPVFLDSLWQGKFGRHYTVADQYEAYNAILQAVSTEGFKARNGEVLRISPERLAESVKRVLQLKFDRPPITKAVPWAMPGEDVTTPKAAKIIVGNPFYRKSAQLVADASITLVKCASGRSLEGVSPEQKILVVYPQFERLTPADNSFNEAVSLDNQIRQYHENTQAVMVRKPVPADETPGQKAARESQEAALREKRPDLKMTTDIDEIVASAKDSEVVIVPTYFGHQSEFQTSLVKRLIATGKRVVVIAMGNPYDISGFPEVDTYLCTYSVREPSMLAAAKALFGKLNKVRQTKPGEEGIEGSVMYPDWLEVDKIKDGTQLRPSRIPFTYGEPGFTGRLPVTIEGIAEKGDGLSSFAEGATRRATGAAAGESAVARAEGAAAVQNPKAQTIVTLDTKAIAAKKSVLVIDELLGRGTETQKYIADAENFGFKTVDLLTAALTKEEASEEGKNYDLVVLRDASGQFILLGQNLDLTLPDTSLEDGRLKSEIDTWL